MKLSPPVVLDLVLPADRGPAPLAQISAYGIEWGRLDLSHPAAGVKVLLTTKACT